MLFRAPESHPRSLIKAISWRLVGSLDTFIISTFITHKPYIAASIAGTETLTKIVLYYAHERGWALVPWGRPRAEATTAEQNSAVAMAPVPIAE
jgi:uncharacterized membrane protein